MLRTIGGLKILFPIFARNAAHHFPLAPPSMNDSQLLRYSRHILLNEISIEGQQKLLNATALVIGCGGLGAAALPYLAAAGIGTLIIADHDRVDETNLQRQISYREADIGSLKTEAMQQFLQQQNSGCRSRRHAR